MRCCIVFCLMFLFLIPVVAEAQIDPGPDAIGIYFDAGGDLISVPAEAGDVIVAMMYMTNPSETGTMYTWEARVDPSGSPDEPQAFVTGEVIYSYNYAMNMPGDVGYSMVALPDPPTPLTVFNLLAMLLIEVVDDTAPINLYVSGFYMTDPDGPEIAMNPISGSPDLPVAVINGPAPSPVQSTTWGELKVEYR